MIPTKKRHRALGGCCGVGSVQRACEMDVATIHSKTDRRNTHLENPGSIRSDTDLFFSGSTNHSQKKKETKTPRGYLEWGWGPVGFMQRFASTWRVGRCHRPGIWSGYGKQWGLLDLRLEPRKWRAAERRQVQNRTPFFFFFFFFVVFFCFFFVFLRWLPAMRFNLAS